MADNANGTASPAEPAPVKESLWSKIMVLKGALRELWVIFGTKILSIVAYGLVNSTLILWLSKDIGFGDVSAGLVVATWSTILTLITVMVGSLVDAIGVKKSLIIGFIFCLIARACMSFITMPWLVILTGLTPLAVGEALMTPVMVAAVKKYATTKQRSMAFSMFYVMMNIGFAISGYMFDTTRRHLGEYGSFTLPGLDCQLSTYQTLILVGFIFTIPNLLLVCLGIRENVRVDENDQVVFDDLKKVPDANSGFRQALRSCGDALVEWKRIFTSLWHQPAFYRFLAFLGIVVGVRLIFYHFHYTFPKFAIRELGEGAPIGRLWSMLNPILIIILVPIMGALTQKVSAYKTVIIGSFIGSFGVSFLAMPPAWFQSLADGPLGNFVVNTWLKMGVDTVNPLYISILFGVIFISIGEAIFSPRLYEYPAAIAPKGQEGSYMSLSMLPMFVAKFFVGALSGWLLMEFCPENGPRHPQIMWLIITVMALFTPVGLWIFRPWIQVKEAGRDE